jgi:hypothetical protein
MAVHHMSRSLTTLHVSQMVGYKGRDGIERFGLVNDFTDPSQNEFMKILIDEVSSPLNLLDPGVSAVSGRANMEPN